MNIQRRKSALAGHTPTQPATTTTGTPTSAGTTSTTGSAGAAGGAGSGGDRTKITVTMPRVTVERARSAYLNALAKGEARSFADYITKAVETYTRGVERSYNEGKEFEGIPAGVIPTNTPRTHMINEDEETK